MNDEPSIKDIFGAAIELRGAARGAYLDRACAGDTVRARVEELLSVHDEGSAEIFEAPAAAEGGITRDVGAAAPGSRIGRYRLLRTVGEGGFGVVFEAEQTEPVVRRVAVKIIKLGMDTRQVIARFEAERQALAMMDHSGIAKVFDAGATSEGRPYFVMELVKGVPITDYCDRHNLPTDERLALFSDVCHAVQHAHQKGVVHRDIKPSNVLVAVHDGKPAPKVIDFGIAKATNQPLSEKTVFTEHHQLIGTPEYMSPEQAEVSELDIDTRSDIYSLGVLLYELLTGTTPFDGARLRSAAYGEIQRIIVEEEPPKPSTRLVSMLETAASQAASAVSSAQEIARHRRTDPSGLERRLRGDLDWIIMKALEKDRTRRYETPSALAADIGRHLASEPVSAGPPSASYRFRKFARRHRPAMVSGGVVAAALVLGLTAAVYGFVDASQERDEKEIAWQQAVRARHESEAVTDFLADLLGSVDPKLLGRQVLVTDVLDEAAMAIETEFFDQPLVRARLRFTIGEAYRALGEYAAAEPHLLLSEEIRRRELGAGDPETARATMGLAWLDNARGRYPSAERRATEALAAMRLALGPDHEDALSALGGLGDVLHRQDRLEEAEPVLAETLERRRRALGPEHRSTLISMNNLGGLYLSQGRLDAAGALFEQALEIRRRTIGEEHPSTLVSKMNLARFYARQQRQAEAEPLYRAAVAAAPAVFGEAHRTTLVFTNNLAKFYCDQDRWAEAEPLYARSVELHRDALGPDYYGTGITLLGYGRCLTRLGRLAEAEPVLLDAHHILAAARGPTSRFTVESIRAIVELFEAAGRRDDAATWRAKLPPE